MATLVPDSIIVMGRIDAIRLLPPSTMKAAP
ncbi:hypothetical protein J2W40_003671 [Sphingobium xenophagum]|uniref:Uncharacterized protein n=1 Tax=Sphingobium xenophagum TaxID=121428 RepID=A0ABU1X5G5_SPHXE|nr:hypothetical protein [Sphingobium xenophagum]